MAQISQVLRSVEGGGLLFFCPGCRGSHMVTVGEGPGPRWGFNGSADRPTFTPSILVRQGHFIEGHTGQCYCTWPDKDEFPDLKCGVCHSFVTDGRIQFLGDSTHELAGQTVDLPAWPESEVAS